MKIVCLGDIHGRNIWKEIVKKEVNFDRFIFLADYFDSREGITPEDQKLNFEEIVRFKKENGNKVILLFGNHDFHYLEGIQEHYSGWQMWSSMDIRIMLSEALKEDLMKMCHIEDNYLFSHAGVTKTWLKENVGVDISNKSLEACINQLFKYKPKHFGFVNKGDIYGDHPAHSPIWVRPRSLKEDRLDNFVQIVGHTTQDCIKLNLKEENVILIDALGTSREYLVIEDKSIKVGTIL